MLNKEKKYRNAIRFAIILVLAAAFFPYSLFLLLFIPFYKKDLLNSFLLFTYRIRLTKAYIFLHNHVMSLCGLIVILIKPVFVSVVATLLLTGGIFSVLPKESWINLKSTPSHFELNDFWGGYLIRTNSIKLDNGYLTNIGDATIRINGEVYELGDKEFSIVFQENPESIPDYKARNPDWLTSGIVMNEQIKVDSASLSHVENANIQIVSEYNILEVGRSLDSLYLRDETLPEEYTDELYSIFVGSDHTMSATVYIPCGEELFFNNASYVSIFASVRGSIIKITPDTSIEIISDSPSKRQLFSMYYQSVKYAFLDDSNYSYITGTCHNFSGSAKGLNNILKLTYLNTQKEYDIGTLRVNSVSEDSLQSSNFSVEYEFSKRENQISIFGTTRDLLLAGTPLRISFSTFLYDNFSNVIMAFLGTFIAYYIPLVLSRSKEK